MFSQSLCNIYFFKRRIIYTKKSYQYELIVDCIVDKFKNVTYHSPKSLQLMQEDKFILMHNVNINEKTETKSQ